MLDLAIFHRLLDQFERDYCHMMNECVTMMLQQMMHHEHLHLMSHLLLVLLLKYLNISNCLSISL